MILKEVKPGKYVESRRVLRDTKVKRLRADAKSIVDNLHMDFANDEKFINEMRSEIGGNAMQGYYFDFSHVSEGAFHAATYRVSAGLQRMIFLKQVSEMNRSLI